MARRCQAKRDSSSIGRSVRLPRHRGEERFFAPEQEADAYQWLIAGGLALQRQRRSGRPAYRVTGRWPAVLDWGARHGLDRRALRRSGRSLHPYYDVSGALAEELERAAREAEEEVAI